MSDSGISEIKDTDQISILTFYKNQYNDTYQYKHVSCHPRWRNLI